MILSIFSYAQNQFVYVRYNPKHGNASAIVNTIDNIVNDGSGRVIIFISNASNPIIAYNGSEWEDVRLVLLRMQTANEYYAENEAILLNSFFSELFTEVVNDQLHIKGAFDKAWVCTFIVSKDMLCSDEFESLAENISVNELYERMPVDILTYNNSLRLELAQIATNKMFKFNISE